ncbi:MAG: hypothetical protein JO306_01245 [Gemmatimonadetes bacterium]|nr:hypothetical protein [Gemmatimonadota bacterium]
MILAACSRSAESSGSALAGEVQPVPVSSTLTGTVLYAGDALAKPQWMGVVGPWLVVADHGGGPLLHVIDRHDRHLVASWGRTGGGPGEFRTIWSVVPGDLPESAWIFDPTLSRLTLLDVGTLARGEARPVRRMVLLRSDASAMDVRWNGDTALVGTGLFAKGRLAVFDSAGRLTRFAGPLPPARAGVPAQVAQHAYMGSLARHPSRGLFAIATRHADRLEIYAPDGSLLKTVRGPAGFDPVFTVQTRAGSPVLATGEDLRFGYVDLAAAGDRLFALYSGHTRAERPGWANFGDEVHVFDWDGRLRARYRLDHPALTIAVDASGPALYATRHEPVPAVVEYRIPATTPLTAAGAVLADAQKRAAPRLSTGAAPLSGGPFSKVRTFGLLERLSHRASARPPGSPPGSIWASCDRLAPADSAQQQRPTFQPSDQSHRPGATRTAFSACASSPCGSPARLPGVPEMTVALHSEPMIRVPPEPVKSPVLRIFSQS